MSHTHVPCRREERARQALPRRYAEAGLGICPVIEGPFWVRQPSPSTWWLAGRELCEDIHLGFDTPEPATEICGGEAEVELAHLASKRLLELLNSNSWTVETFGIDGTGRRLLGTIRIDGRDVGDILISEALARSWPEGDEWWCR